MKYIPRREFDFVKGYLTIAVHSDSHIGRISDLDPKKIISKFGDFHRKTAIGFVDEDGMEYAIIVGTKTSPINELIIQVSDPTYEVHPIIGSFDAATCLENNEKMLARKKRLSMFIEWLRTQNLLRNKEGD